MSANRAQRLAAYRSSRQRYRPGRRQFEQLVAEALADLPSQFRQRLQNVAVIVDEWPSQRQMASNADDDGDSLLGLYEGTPYGDRGTAYHLVPPDRITIFRGPILALCKTREEVLREVRDTVIHEVGHFFGLDERELH